MRISDWSSDVCSSDLHFELLDERSADELLRDAREDVLAAAKADVDSPLAVALAGITCHAGEDDFAKLMKALADERHRLARLFAATGGLVGAVALLRRRLGVAQGETDESLRAEGCEDARSEEHTSELQSLMRLSYAVFCLKKQ